ncbi:hypothetical protein BOTBODRAFT_64330 [Botryobasidium botryosum FD-172 SS1]|uniref:Protein N-terminal and lysine N-methyltransferase EFM7 n=1 Tax=Botryobasidium botryosum (strain FD-172 SS1) TaxID=930990 RepID=A0A067MRN5_BOTB1|nr:hypothetical protein BOTBODRAFT_64330 [Botryobasidium botryosum FD-172 SS1]
MADEEIGLGDIFTEPPRPPSPEPTVAVYHRSRQTRSEDGWDRLLIRLVGSHPLWGHHLWNAGIAFATYLDQNAATFCQDKRVLELGAGGALPGLVAALNGAKKVVLTDYPDRALIDNIEQNVRTNIPPNQQDRVNVQGYTWGKAVDSLIAAVSDTHPSAQDNAFDLIILSDLVFNHSQHDALLNTCEATLAKGSSPYGTPCLLVFYTHHRPHLAEKDLDFFRKAEARGWRCEEFLTERMKAMFPEDPGDAEVRSTVHGWRVWRRA